MRLTERNMDTINEIARQVYIALTANKSKAQLLDSIDDTVECCEDDFRNGVNATFDHDGMRVSCRLVLNPSPKWLVKDVVLSPLTAK